MKMQLESGAYRLISAYGPGVLAVDGTDYRGNILITRSRVIEHWYEGPLEALTVADFAPVLEPADAEERAEILLLGTGDTHRFAPMRLAAELGAQGIALEVMHTRAACRTYSVLVNEARPVAAALLQISSGE